MDWLNPIVVAAIALIGAVIGLHARFATKEFVRDQIKQIKVGDTGAFALLEQKLEHVQKSVDELKETNTELTTKIIDLLADRSSPTN